MVSKSAISKVHRFLEKIITVGDPLDDDLQCLSDKDKLESEAILKELLLEGFDFSDIEIAAEVLEILIDIV